MFTKKEENLGVPITKLCVVVLIANIVSKRESFAKRSIF